MLEPFFGSGERGEERGVGLEGRGGELKGLGWDRVAGFEIL